MGEGAGALGWVAKPSVGWWEVGSGQWAMGDKKWAKGDRKWEMGDRKRAMGDGLLLELWHPWGAQGIGPGWALCN